MTDLKPQTLKTGGPPVSPIYNRNWHLVPKAPLFLDAVEIPISSIAAHRVFIWGWADYDDIFDATPRHRTEFCCRVVVIPQNPAQMMVRFETYRMHNGYDDDCFREPSPYAQPV